MGDRKKHQSGENARRPDNDQRPADRPDRVGQLKGEGHVHGPNCGCGNSHPFAAQKSLPDFPAEVVFKAVFRNRPYIMEELKTVCGEAGIDAEITDRVSRNGTFISFTITAVYPADEILKSVCSRVGALEGFYTMF